MSVCVNESVHASAYACEVRQGPIVSLTMSCITITGGAELTRTVSSAAWMPSSEIG